jgi:hypothetical protein
LVKVESVQRAKGRDHTKYEDVACEVHKSTKKKPSQVKVKVEGDLMGVVMEKISGMIMSAFWFHGCYM